MTEDDIFEITCRCGEKTLLHASLYKKYFCSNCGAELISWEPNFDVLIGDLYQLEEKLYLWED